MTFEHTSFPPRRTRHGQRDRSRSEQAKAQTLDRRRCRRAKADFRGAF